ncbi:hypothetical protein, partial [Streptomyces broussonetiae]|uniref:hypothetical protein n=1 Tax=Streptomyces broussonetiae TaxID=2686304 RepID=UPI0035DFB97F
MTAVASIGSLYRAANSAVYTCRLARKAVGEGKGGERSGVPREPGRTGGRLVTAFSSHRAVRRPGETYSQEVESHMVTTATQKSTRLRAMRRSPR